MVSAAILWRPPKEVLACEQQTPIYRDVYIDGIMLKDAGI